MSMFSLAPPLAAGQRLASTRSFWADNVVFLPLADGSGRILDLDGEAHAVSAPGGRMIQLVLERGTAAAADAIAEEYQLSPGLVRRDVDALLAQLQKARLVRTGTRHACWRRI